ncbi:hypothetical protein IQ254_12120 [Nodosilinea sp. LEGE 07088]|uniref:hypothetical protein n=1 Tax=Nodosilinea sp. LEGE 07088 TaxID=2777968 RepID=UPI001880FAAD|nr:hypothetical protein [Nodosilinea sp. LEGE 07088]MBE9137929.1 hypothetical protein [Nodosilinea sp. LEGE 07088]
MTLSPSNSATAHNSTPISLPLRAWLAVEILFGVAAIEAVFLHPDQTATNFAWPIQPIVMAATFGSFYLSVGLMFILGTLARRWQQVRAVSIPAAIFTGFMLLTTFLHWDKFNHGIPPFYIWFASYLLPPPIFVALYYSHQKKAAPIGMQRLHPIAQPIRQFWVINGLIITLITLLFYLAPTWLITIAPWTMTPLTARTLCGWLIAVGTLQMWMAWEGDWGRIKIASTLLVILPFALLFQWARYSSEVNWSSLSLWLLLLDFSFNSFLCIYLWCLWTGRRSSL